MSRPAKRDISKLPVWAQNQINKLEGDVRHYQEDVRHYQEEIRRMIVGENENTVFYCYGGDPQETPLPAQGHVRFYLPNGNGEKDRRAYIEIDNKGDHLYVRSEGTFFAGDMAVTPHAGNVFLIRLVSSR